MSGNQAPLRAADCASAGTAYPPISTPTILPPSNPCIYGYTSGSLHTTYTLPYNLTTVLPHISSFGNIDWTGQIDPGTSSVALNGTDNEPGTARAYTLADGARLVETLLSYSSPPAGQATSLSGSSAAQQLVEVHSIAHLYQPLDRDATNVSLTSDSVEYAAPNGTFGFYAARDGMRVAGACSSGGGQPAAATTFDFSADFCATDADAAARWFRARHLNAMATLGRMLGGGGENVTDCASLDAAGGGGGGDGGSAGSAAESPPSSAASHQQIRMSMGTAVSLVLAACMAFAALMA